MEPRIPEWLTADFLHQSLERDPRYREITVTDFTATLAAPAGNNYGSLVFRVIINCLLGGDERELAVIVKGPITEGAIGEILKEMSTSEPSFYNVFLPEAYKLLPDRFAPDSFHSTNPSVVIMEDLKKSGYLMADRTKQLDFDHCLLYTNAAAAFHATSIALHKQNPEMINSVCVQPLYSDENKAAHVMALFNKWALECLANHVADKRISQIVNDTAEHIWRMLIDIHKPHASLNCLLQGDPWTTNMMFKYDSDGKVRDIKLIDFQMLNFGPPAHDLVFFIWLSTNKDVKRHRLRELYLNYVTQLNRHLLTLDCSEVDFGCFMKTVGLFSPFALASAAILPSLLGPVPADFNEICVKASDVAKGMTTTKTNPFERYYTEPFCRIDLPEIVDRLEAEGVFDYLEDKLKSMKYILSEP